MNNAILTFGLGTTEIVLICAVVILLFGAKKIPEFARSLGKAKREFDDAKSSFNDAVEEEASQKQQKKNIAPPMEDEIKTTSTEKVEAKKDEA